MDSKLIKAESIEIVKRLQLNAKKNKQNPAGVRSAYTEVGFILNAYLMFI
jgi:hypothetical protein